MRIIITMLTFVVLASSAQAAEGNSFIKGGKSYQKSATASDSIPQADDGQIEASAENLDDISPAAGASEEGTEKTTKEIMVEDLQLPRK